AKAYFVLRRAIRKLYPGLVIRPSTELATIRAGRSDDYRLCRQLKEDTGLEMPTFSGSWGASMLVLATRGAEVYSIGHEPLPNWAGLFCFDLSRVPTAVAR